jgi:hypothetical protein
MDRDSGFGASNCPHTPQNFRSGGTDAPQAGQVCWSWAPHCSQKRTTGRLSNSALRTAHQPSRINSGTIAESPPCGRIFAAGHAGRMS